MYECDWAIDKFDAFEELFKAIEKCAALMNDIYKTEDGQEKDIIDVVVVVAAACGKSDNNEDENKLIPIENVDNESVCD